MKLIKQSTHWPFKCLDDLECEDGNYLTSVLNSYKYKIIYEVYSNLTCVDILVIILERNTLYLLSSLNDILDFYWKRGITQEKIQMPLPGAVQYPAVELDAINMKIN